MRAARAARWRARFDRSAAVALRRAALVVVAALLLVAPPAAAAAATRLQAGSVRAAAHGTRARAVPDARGPERRLSSVVADDPRVAGRLPPAIVGLAGVALLMMAGGLLGRVVRRRMARSGDPL